MSQWPMVPLGEVLTQYKDYIDAPEPKTYTKLSVKLYGKGVTLDTPTDGTDLKMKRHQLAKAGQVILSEIWGKKGAIGFVPQLGEGALCTSHFFLFDVVHERLLPKWLEYIFRANYLEKQLDSEAKGTTGYAAVRPAHLFKATIPLPPLPEQRRLVERIDALAAKIEEAKRLRCEADKERSALESSFTNDIFSHATMAWPRRPLGELADIQSGVTLGRSISGPTSRRPYLRVANVQDGYFDLSVIKEIDIRPDEFEKWKLLPGDLLLTEGGDWDKLGRGAVWRGEIPDCIHQNHIFRVRVAKDVIDPEFLALLTASPYGKSYFQDASKQTTNLASINQRQLKAFPVFVPSIDEQQHTISRVYALREKLRVSHKAQTESGREINAMIPAILDRAFRGEL